VSSTLHKISEIYDRVAFAAVGKYSEFEDLRIAGVRLADLRGYSYGRDDVKARDLANAYSQTLSTIFTQQMKPYEVELLIGEVGEVNGIPTAIYHLLFDGSITDEHEFVAIGGNADRLTETLGSGYDAASDLDAAVRKGIEALSSAEDRPIQADAVEAGVLDRTRPSRRKFRRLSEAEVASILREG
jgi:proteasome alpha subunit